MQLVTEFKKYLDNLPADNRPHLLQMGHFHQSLYLKQDNTHCFQTSCLENETPYTRSQGYNNDKSVWWVDATIDKKGYLQNVKCELESFDKKKLKKF